MVGGGAVVGGAVVGGAVVVGAAVVGGAVVAGATVVGGAVVAGIRVVVVVGASAEGAEVQLASAPPMRRPQLIKPPVTIPLAARHRIPRAWAVALNPGYGPSTLGQPGARRHDR